MRPASSGPCGRASGDNLKSIAAIRDWPPLRQPLRDFVDWVARWTLSPRGMVLRMAIRAHEVIEPPPPKFGVVATGKPPARMTEARARVLAAIAGADGPVAKAALAERARCSTGVIDGLVEDGALAAVALPPERIAAGLDPDFRPTILNDDQKPAAADLVARVAARAFSATLLEGVTGSGKTEVYFEAVAEALRQGRQALVLLPEIALTAQFLDRFAARFGARPAEWHSGLSERQRERIWGAVASGEARVVVGARSALFLPFADLGLIVVDEEHEGAYKQEDGVVYNARDMAVVRARLEAAPVVLASATPALETRVNAETGRYRWLRLPSRFGAATMPDDRDRRPQTRRAAARTLAVAEGDRRGGGGARARRAGAAVPQPARLCAAHPLPLVRPSVRVPELLGLAGRAPLPRAARLPPLRPCRRHGRNSARNATRLDSLTACGPGVERLAEEAALHFPGRPHARAVVRLSRRDRDPAPTARCGGEGRVRPHHRHPARRQGPSISRCSPSSAWSTPTSASPTPIRAPPSAPSSFCARRPGGPGGSSGRATRCCRPGSPSIR